MPATKKTADQETPVESNVRRSTRMSLASQSSPARPKRLSTVSTTSAKTAPKETEGNPPSRKSISTRTTTEPSSSTTKTKETKVTVRKSVRSSRASSVEQSPSPSKKLDSSTLSQITEESTSSTTKQSPKTSTSPKKEAVRNRNPRLTRRASSVEQSPPTPTKKSSSPTLAKVVEETAARQGNTSPSAVESKVPSTPKRSSRLFTSASNVATPRSRRTAPLIPSSPVTPSRRSRRIQARIEDIPEPSKSSDADSPSRKASETEIPVQSAVSPKLRRSITLSGSPKTSPDRHAKCGPVSPLAIGTPVKKDPRRNSFSSPLQRSPHDSPVRTSPRLSVVGVNALPRSPSPLLGLEKSASPSQSKRSSLPVRSPAAAATSNSTEEISASTGNTPEVVEVSTHKDTIDDSSIPADECAVVASEKEIIEGSQPESSTKEETFTESLSSKVDVPYETPIASQTLPSEHQGPSSTDVNLDSSLEKCERTEICQKDLENQSPTNVSSVSRVVTEETPTKVEGSAEGITEAVTLPANDRFADLTGNEEMNEGRVEVDCSAEETLVENHTPCVESVSSSEPNSANEEKSQEKSQSAQNESLNGIVSVKQENDENQSVDNLPEITSINQSSIDESPISKTVVETSSAVDAISEETIDTNAQPLETAKGSTCNESSEILFESPASPDEPTYSEDNVPREASVEASPQSPRENVDTSHKEPKPSTLESAHKLDDSSINLESSTEPLESLDVSGQTESNTPEEPTKQKHDSVQEISESENPSNDRAPSIDSTTSKIPSENEVIASATSEIDNEKVSTEVTHIESSLDCVEETANIALPEDQCELIVPDKRLTSDSATDIAEESSSELIPEEDSKVNTSSNQDKESNSNDKEASLEVSSVSETPGEDSLVKVTTLNEAPLPIDTIVAESPKQADERQDTTMSQNAVEEEAPSNSTHIGEDSLIEDTSTLPSPNKISSLDSSFVEPSEQANECQDESAPPKALESDPVGSETKSEESKLFSKNDDSHASDALASSSEMKTGCINSPSTILDVSSDKSKDDVSSVDRESDEGEKHSSALLIKEEVQKEVMKAQDGSVISDGVTNVTTNEVQGPETTNSISPIAKTSPKRKSSSNESSSPPKVSKKDPEFDGTQEEGDFKLSIEDSDDEKNDNETPHTEEKADTVNGKCPLDQTASDPCDASVGNDRHANALDDTFSIDSGHASEDDEKPRSRLELIEEVEEEEELNPTTKIEVSLVPKDHIKPVSKQEDVSCIILSDGESEAGVLDQSCFIVGDPTDYNKLGNYSESEDDGSVDGEEPLAADSKGETNVESDQKDANQPEKVAISPKAEFASSAAVAFVAKDDNEVTDAGADNFASTSAGLFVTTKCEKTAKRGADVDDKRAAKKRRKENMKQEDILKSGISVTICNIPGDTSLQRLKGVLKEYEALNGLLSLQIRESKVDAKFVTAVATYDSVKNLQKALSTYGKISINRHPLYFLVDEQVSTVDKPKKSPKKVAKFAGIISNLAPGVDIHEIASTLKAHGVEHLKNVKTYKPKSSSGGLFTARLEFRNKTALLKAVAVAENIRLGGRKINFKIREK